MRRALRLCLTLVLVGGASFLIFFAGFAAGASSADPASAVAATETVPPATPTPAPTPAPPAPTLAPPTPAPPVLTPAPTVALAPTATAIPSPAAPAPPAPTVALAPCPTTFEAAWLQTLRQGVPAINQGFSDLGDLSARVANDPSLLGQASFRAAYVAQADTVKATARQILDFTLTPPLHNPALYGISKTMARAVIAGMDDLVDALSHFEAGQDLGGLQALRQAGFAIDDAVFYMDAVTEGIDGYCDG